MSDTAQLWQWVVDNPWPAAIVATAIVLAVGYIIGKVFS